MAGTFPNLSDGNPVKAGFTHSLLIRCQVNRYRSGKEQRWAVSGLLNSFRLPYNGIKWVDLAAIRDFIITQKGAFDSTWKLHTLDPSSRTFRDYNNLGFDSDEFSYTENEIGRYTTTVSASQTIGETVVLVGQTVYPTINGNVRVQLPFVTSLSYQTDRNDLDSGKRISYAAWAAPLRRWQLEYPVIDDNELKVLVDFYIGQGGPVLPFSFQDPNTGVVHANCRYGYAPLVITRVSTGINRVSLTLEEFLA